MPANLRAHRFTQAAKQQSMLEIEVPVEPSICRDWATKESAGQLMNPGQGFGI